MVEGQKSSHRLTPGAFRSGCYKRAITILQHDSGDYSGRDATAASLYRLLTSANSKDKLQAHQTGEHLSRSAASIEPEDGECTPSPSALQQAKTAAKRSHQLSAPIVQALPPPPLPVCALQGVVRSRKLMDAQQ
ncbi:hypothetical protein WJX82_009341 [Trebouxia sp. C0006]